MVDYRCPGSAASMHAKCKMRVTFAQQQCARIKTEAKARIAAGPAFDPHNGGSYSLLAESPSSLSVQRVTGTGSMTKYTDLIELSFEYDPEIVGCVLTACSESQGPSYFDFSTNYCNSHVLYCNGAEGCPSILESELMYDELFIDCGAGATHDASKCIPGSVGLDMTPWPPSSLLPVPASPPPLGAAVLGSPFPPPPLHTLPSHQRHDVKMQPNGSPIVLLQSLLLLAAVIGALMAGTRRARQQRNDRDSLDEHASGSSSSSSSGTAGTSSASEDRAPDWELNDAARAACGTSATV